MNITSIEADKYIKQISTKVKEEIESNVLVGNFVSAKNQKGTQT